nr:hypothetical protein [Petropleomorpha daqingensis]
MHTGAGRRRGRLLVLIFAGTVLLAIAAVVVLPLVKGTAEEQSTQAVQVFYAALEQGDTDTAYSLLCNDERARLQPDQVAGKYVRSGTPTVGKATADPGDSGARVVTVRWTDGGAVTSTFLTVVNEDGAHICGTTTDG